jgi:sRNA-binding carbon storage regulator CsrA
MPGERTSLIVEIRPGDVIHLGDKIIDVELIQKSGQSARLKVTAPRDVVVVKEKHERCQ